ncbi:DEAD/DEAH box helicase [Parvibaculum sp.]|uniref:DEAD/DEAH box helicase n=1 Tax=Parvibaculum sp. TaxID=2024848 RepID=UPI0027342B3E|nr:DEAD/DEAH box helicase [Parvibaculum sp.]MDP3328756.1 DEAD/DEAH box helicase [Parvibaculum sp.]
MPVILRDYQEHGVTRIRASLQTHQAPLFVAPTGAGKTVLFSYIAAAASAKGNRVTIVAHRFELLAQISLALGRFGIHHGIIAPGITPDPRALVQVASVQALASRLKRSSFTIPTDLLIVDEAHHVQQSNSWGRIYAALGAPPTLGVTASPIRSDGKGLGVECGGIFDDIIEVISTGELIDQGYLAKPIVYAPAERLDLTGIRSRGGDYEKSELADRVDKPRITGHAVDHYQEICRGLTSVAFGVSIEHCQHISEEFRSAGHRFEVIDGDMDKDRRKDLIAGLGKGIDGLVSCDLIGEGVDIPAIGCAIMLRPTHSTGLHVQQMGRPLRPIYADGFDVETMEGRFGALAAAGKTNAFILDHVGNSLVHGLPETPREWSLAGITRKQRKAEESALPIKQCEKCYAVYPAGPICSICGHEQSVASRKVEQVEGKLRKITPEEAAAIALQKKKERRQVNAARTLTELQNYAENKGYSPTWAEHVFNARERAAQKRIDNQAQSFLRLP